MKLYDPFMLWKVPAKNIYNNLKLPFKLLIYFFIAQSI